MSRSTSGNIQTNRVAKKVGGANFRLSKSDREFLSDLSRTTVIDEVTANKEHYKSNSSASTRRLDRLVEIGILDKSHTVDPTHGKIAYYEFKNSSVAKSFGGRTASIGVNRQALHEIYVSRSYFSVGRPSDFRVSTDFDKSDYKLFGTAHPSERSNFVSTTSLHHAPANESALPDALYTNSSGELVVVEADAGHYNSRQISQKQSVWRNYKQLWVQPEKPAAKVSTSNNVSVLTY